MIEATIPSDNAISIYSGTCFAPTSSMPTLVGAIAVGILKGKIGRRRGFSRVRRCSCRCGPFGGIRG
jgi:hypothetical protein